MSAPGDWALGWLLVWGVAVGFLWLPRRYSSWVVRIAGTSFVRAGLLTLAVHLVGALLFISATFLIDDLLVTDSPTWPAAVLFVLAGMVYSPFVGMGLHVRNLDPVGDIRLALKEAGATLGQERAVAWTGGLLAFFGMTAIFLATLALFG